MSHRVTPLRIVATGSIIALLIVAYALIAENPPQCPLQYQPVAGDRCIIGANIGLGLLMFLADGVLATAAIIAFGMYSVATIRSSKALSAWVPRVMVASVALVLFIYGGAQLSHSIVLHFLRS